MTLDQLVAHLRAALGDALRAVVLYGSAASGEHHEKHSDVNVLVVVDRLGSAELGPAMSDVTRGWRDAGNPAPLLLTVREWQGSADIFPMDWRQCVGFPLSHGPHAPQFDSVEITT